MTEKFLLVLVIVGVGLTDNGESLAPIKRCDKICALQLRYFHDLERNFVRLHRKSSGESIQVWETNTRKWKKKLDQVRRLYCIRKCLKHPRISRKVHSYQIVRSRREAVDSRQSQCPKVGPSSAVVQNTSVVLTRTNPQDKNLKSNWSVVVRWNPLEGPLINWTGYNVAWIDFDKMPVNEDVLFTCIIVPKNQTTLIITEQDGWAYPHTIQLVVTTYPAAAPNSPVREYKFVKEITTTTKLLDFKVTTPMVTPSTIRVTSPMTKLPVATKENNLTSGHIVAICAGVIVGVVLVIGLLLGVRHVKRSDSTQTLSGADVFISYSRANYKWVNENLYPLMDQYSITYLIDYKDFEPGEPWLETMVNCIQRSHKILIIMSSEYMSRRNCQAELNQAMYWARGGKKLIVLRINDVNKDTLPDPIRNRTFIDYADKIERKTWKKRLVNSLKASRAEKKLLSSQFSIIWSRSATSRKIDV